MGMDAKETKDIEVHLGKIDERFLGLEKNLNLQLGAIKESITDLKNNFVDRLNKLEMSKLSSSDFTAYRTLEFTPMEKKVATALEEIEKLKDLPKKVEVMEIDKINPLSSTVSFQQKLIYIGMGIVIALQIGIFIYLNFIKK